jgi:hypothetical protein
VPYTDLNTIHNPATGTVAPATWGDQIRTNEEFLIDSPVCSISQSTSQTVATATLVVLGTTSLENFDNDAMHSDSTNRSRITIQTAGRYLFLGNAVTDLFIGNDPSFVRVSFRIDGTTSVGGSQIKTHGGATSRAIRLTAARSLVLSVGQYVEMTTQHDLGGDIQVTLDELVAQFLTR